MCSATTTAINPIKAQVFPPASPTPILPNWPTFEKVATSAVPVASTTIVCGGGVTVTKTEPAVTVTVTVTNQAPGMTTVLGGYAGCGGKGKGY